CAPRPRTARRKTQFATASSTRTTASECRSDGHSHSRRLGIMPGRLGPPVRIVRDSSRSSLKGLAMESVTAFAPRRQEALSSAGGAPVSEAGKALAVTATYLLSEDGRKASLLAGGDGRARQQLTIEVPVNR